jgi:hypothetical protein
MGFGEGSHRLSWLPHRPRFSYPWIDISASLMSRIEQIAYLEHLAAHVTSAIAQLEHDRL